jgi:hypothetical protein
MPSSLWQKASKSSNALIGMRPWKRLSVISHAIVNGIAGALQIVIQVMWRFDWRDTAKRRRVTTPERSFWRSLLLLQIPPQGDKCP